MPQTQEKTCKDKVSAAFANRQADIEKLFRLDQAGDEEGDPDIGTWSEYGLCFDYVAPGTFTDQERGYFRYQLSYGGPSEEYRFYCDERLAITSVEFWYLDWFDGAKVDVTGGSLGFWREAWADWIEMELPQSKLAEAED